MRPLHEALRAIGQGATCGTVISIVAAVTITYLGTAGMIALAVIAGPGLMVASTVLERCARRASNGDDTK